MKYLFLLLFFVPVLASAGVMSTPIREGAISQVGSVKYVYAELVYQRNFGSDVCWVNGASLQRTMVEAINKTKVSSDALDILGNDGWELTTAVTRNFDGGFEIYYYLRKQVQ